MLFRGRQAEASVWRRFRSGADDFTFTHESGVFEARVVANAERVVDLLHALAEQLPPAVDVAIEDARERRSWRGVTVALPDVRESIARLKAPLAAYGGVELAVYSADDQLTLTPDLELYIYARTDRWLYILQGKGLHEVTSFGPQEWPFDRDALGAAPELSDAVAAAAERLGLEPQ
jgi:hypothetical protein